MDLGTLVGHIKVGDEYKKDLNTAKKDFGTLGDSIEHSVSSVGPKLAKAGKAIGAVGGTAIAGTLAAGFANSVNFDAAQHKLQAQLGGNAQFAGEMGKVAGELYANAYGGSLDEVNDALRTVVQSGALAEDATNDDIKSITGQAMSLASAFGVDV